MAEARLCRRHRYLFGRGHRKARFQQPARLGFNVDPQQRVNQKGEPVISFISVAFVERRKDVA
jgi:hypothetical protein